MNKARRGRGEDAIYPVKSKGCYAGAISLGFDSEGKRIRRTVYGRTKQDVKDKLDAIRNELKAGIHTSATYTVRQCVEDWLKDGTGDVSASTLDNYRLIAQHIIVELGSKTLKDLKAPEVSVALQRLAGRMSSRSVKLARMTLVRPIRHAELGDLVGRNVAALTTAPRGQTGRPSRSMTLAQAITLLRVAERSDTLIGDYTILSLLGGIRTEEARELRWPEVDVEAGSVAVYRSVRIGGDTKTPKSRRRLKVSEKAIQAIRRQHERQQVQRASAGDAWREHDLVFASALGTPLDAHNMRRAFRALTRAAELGESWTPRELRHTFVSLLSDSDVSIEDIADLVGHSSSRTTETVYRHQIRPQLTKGAEAMDAILSQATF